MHIFAFSPGKLYRLHSATRSSICRRGQQIESRKNQTQRTVNVRTVRERPRSCSGTIQVNQTNMSNISNEKCRAWQINRIMSISAVRSALIYVALIVKEPSFWQAMARNQKVKVLFEVLIRPFSLQIEYRIL